MIHNNVIDVRRNYNGSQFLVEMELPERKNYYFVWHKSRLKYHLLQFPAPIS